MLCAVPCDRRHAVGVADVERFERHIAHALARLLGGLLGRRERVPRILPLIDGGGAIGLGQPIEMRDVEAGGFHRRQHRFRRRRGGREKLDHMRQRFLFLGGCIEQGRHHNGRAAEMRHLVVGDRIVHRPRAHLAQAHMRSGHHGERPRKAPAVAMEHRQRPEIDAVLAHAAGKHIADCQQVGAAMVVNDALGIAGGARGVVERDGVPFIGGQRSMQSRVARGDEVLVFDCFRSARPRRNTRRRRNR